MYAAIAPVVSRSVKYRTKSGELQIGLVAGRRPVAHRHAEILGLEHRPSLVARLGDERDRLVAEIVAEGLERVEVGVGPEQVGVAGGHQLLQSLLQCLSLLAQLRESGGEDHRESRLLLQHGLEHVDGCAHQDGGQIHLTGDVEDARVALDPVDRLPFGVDRDHLGVELLPPVADLAPHGVVGPAAVGQRRSPPHGRAGRRCQGRCRAAPPDARSDRFVVPWPATLPDTRVSMPRRHRRTGPDSVPASHRGAGRRAGCCSGMPVGCCGSAAAISQGPEGPTVVDMNSDRR